MRPRRVFALTKRLVTQIRRDQRSVGLLLVVPMVIMGLLGYLLRIERGPLQVAMVVEDSGVALPTGQLFSVASTLNSAMGDSKDVEFIETDLERAERELRDGELDLVLVVPENFSQDLMQGGNARLELIVEGSNPGQSQALPAQIGASIGRELARLRPSGSIPEIGIDTRYLYAGPEYEFLDSFAPVYIAFFTFFFVFMLTGVSFLRERTQGTMERLLATPIRRGEIALGYMMGFGIFALLQSSVFLFFTILVLKIRYVGDLALVFLLLALVAVGAVNLGIFLSTYARTELQVVQFIPIVVVPQALLSGLLVPVAELPQALKVLAHGMPLTYANQAMTDVMIRGFGFGQVAGDLAVLLAFAVIALALSATTLRRQFI